MDMPQKLDVPPCHLCTGRCCTYFALEIDKPTTIADFESIKWYLLHEGTMIFVEEGEWFLQVQNKCRFLLPDYRCGIYEHRPQICREYGFDEDGRAHCDKTTEGVSHDQEFTHPAQIDALIHKRFPRAGKYRQPVEYRLSPKSPAAKAWQSAAPHDPES